MRSLSRDPARLGFVLGVLCAAIWGVQAVVSRQSALDGLTAGDVTLLRFATAGLVLLPVALTRNPPFPVGQFGWRRATVLSLLGGAPYSLVLVGGAAFAPALHSAIIVPGLVPLISAPLTYFLAGERFARANLAGLALLLIGVGIFSWDSMTGSPLREEAWRGDLLFLSAAGMWAMFGFLVRRWEVDAVGATISICVLSLLSVPFWAPLLPLRLMSASASAIALQAAYQGVLVGVVSLFLYARTVKLLGAMRAALFLSLVPGFAALAGAVLLGELPSPLEGIGMGVVIAGMIMAFRRSVA